jgi:hypothetical protein
MSLPDLEPVFPLPAPGDMVQVLVSRGSPAAAGLVAGPAPDWCLVVRVATGKYDLFPVTVRLPSGRLGSYQQGEIRGWRPSPPPVRWVTRLLARRLR